MPRSLRIEIENACYHVINRGNYRRNLFEDKGAADAFEELLGEAANRFGWQIHAYVLMRNHFHLALRIGEPNLGVGMKWLQGTWTMRVNRFQGKVGRPFQGRYKALLVEPGHSFEQICHYIHLNPVRAKIVSVAKLDGYARSSFPKFMQKEFPAWLAPETVLHAVGESKSSASAWKRYRNFLGVLDGDPVQMAELSSKKLSRGWCVGSAKFKEEVREDLNDKRGGQDPIRFEGMEPAEIDEAKRVTWEEALVALAQAGKIDLQSLPSGKSAPPKSLLAAAMKQSTSVSNHWLAERLAMGAPASASQFARRLMLDPKGNLAVRKLLSRVKA